VRQRLKETLRVVSRHGGVRLGAMPAQKWRSGRFNGPYQRDDSMDHGLLVETLETATTWARLPRLYSEVRAALLAALSKEGSKPIIMCHVSHVYEVGASLYFTVLAASLEGQEEEQWRLAKRGACEAIVRVGATITHHHSVGVDHEPYMRAEVGELGLEVLRAVKKRLDPKGILNPGKLLAMPGTGT
jgi:alkyldihydroxyacetonephosphate synthase